MTRDIEQHIDKSPGEPTGSQVRSCTDCPFGIPIPGPDIATSMRSDLSAQSWLTSMRSDLSAQSWLAWHPYPASARSLHNRLVASSNFRPISASSLSDGIRTACGG